MILKSAKSLFHNPFGKNKASKLTEAAVILPSCFGSFQGVLALDAVEKDYRTEKELAVIESAAAAAGGIFGVAGAIAAGAGLHILSENIKQYIV